jgi:hypothetical protein
MLEDMQLHSLSANTQDRYIKGVKNGDGACECGNFLSPVSPSSYLLPLVINDNDLKFSRRFADAKT